MTSEVGTRALPPISWRCQVSVLRVYNLEGGVRGGGRCSEKLPVGGACELQELPGRREREKPLTPPLLGLGLGVPAPGLVSQASHVSSVRESLSIKLLPQGLGTGLKAAAVQRAPRMLRGGRVWILNPRGQSVARRLL